MTSPSAPLLQRFQLPSWAPGLLAAIGLLVYLLQALWFAHTSIPNLDEGAYLYKGYLFASGRYEPFEPYGPQTNKAPLAFLIPGYVQLLFGPGLGTGRYLAVFFGVLTVITTWVVARRLAGEWLAAAAVWSFALTPVLIKTHSEAVTQSEVAFLLAMILALTLGSGRPGWQILLGGILAGAMIMIRQNMAPILPLLALYVWWQHGWKNALLCMLGGAAVLVFFHALYWPYIMQLWIPWMPGFLRPLFSQYWLSGSLGAAWDPSIDSAGRILSFFQGVRFHFLAVAGFLFSLILWPRRRHFSEVELRAAVFLAALFAGLLLMHSWAAISNDYCVYCFTPYLAFFSLAAILLTVLILRVTVRPLHPLRQWLLGLSVPALFLGIGYSAVGDLGDSLLSLNVPRLREGRVLSGFTTLWELLNNKFAWERGAAERIVSTLAGLLVALALLAAAFLIFRKLRGSSRSYGYTLAVAVLIFGLLFSPLMAGREGRPDCPGMDVIRASRQQGSYLAERIPPGKMTYWNGGLSVAPLLHAPQVNIYLPQINNGYAHQIGGNPEELLKYGFWNDELDLQWRREADYIIVEGWRYPKMKESLPAAQFDEFPRSPGQTSCVDGSGLRVFQRK
jgi:4-amino-4-deoxy-L-arabinose transferase-like glycosyltransferase